MAKKLRIAQVGAIWETTPPPLYGGTERVVFNLTEELVRRGHKVTLFATGDSKTSARLHSIVDRPLYRQHISWENFLYPLWHLSEAFERADQFDILHIHLNTRQDYAGLVLAGFVKTPTLFTMHFELPKEHDRSKKERHELLLKYRKRNFVSISKAQRTIKELNYIGTAYNGLDFDSYPSAPKKRGDYLLWMGRICHEKGTREAVRVARKTKLPLILAGKIDTFSQVGKAYFKKEIKPYIDGKHIRYVGEINEKEKIELLKKARVLLNPINWNEPFGLVTIEAMGMGIPVIAFDRGPVREQIIPHRTGFIVKTVDQMAAAVKKADALNSDEIQEYAMSTFHARNMTDQYEAIYAKLLKK